MSTHLVIGRVDGAHGDVLVEEEESRQEECGQYGEQAPLERQHEQIDQQGATDAEKKGGYIYIHTHTHIYIYIYIYIYIRIYKFIYIHSEQAPLERHYEQIDQQRPADAESKRGVHARDGEFR